MTKPILPEGTKPLDAAKLDQLRAAARPIDIQGGFVTDFEHNCVLAVGRRPLDIHSTVVSIPLSFLLQAAAMLTLNVACPMLHAAEQATTKKGE